MSKQSEQFSRTRLLIGEDGMKKLLSARVAVFGVGGVGGYAVEALVRSGVGTIDIFDNDRVSLSNLNRQIIATRETVGEYKVDVMKRRARSVNPNAVINAHNCFYMPENADEYDFSEYSYVVDAIDTVTGKLEIITRAKAAEIPVISCMGAGNKLDASAFEVADIYETSVCPLARVMRYELKKRGIENLKVVYSKEKPISPMYDAFGGCDDPFGSDPEGARRRAVPGSMSFVPAVAGLIAAGEVIRDLTGA